MLQSINMKADKLSILLIGLFTSMALATIDLNESFTIAQATNVVEGYYAKASDGSNLTNIKFELEENDAPQAN